MIDNFFGKFSMIDIQNVNIAKICGQNKDWYPIFYIYFDSSISTCIVNSSFMSWVRHKKAPGNGTH